MRPDALDHLKRVVTRALRATTPASRLVIAIRDIAKKLSPTPASDVSHTDLVMRVAEMLQTALLACHRWPGAQANLNTMLEMDTVSR
jgi:hypothetical protein